MKYIKSTFAILTKKFKYKINSYLFLNIILIIIFLFLLKFNKKNFSNRFLEQVFQNNEEDKSQLNNKLAKTLYSKYGKINFNELDKSYNNNTEIFKSFNNIHISLCTNNDYHLLASVTIASILKNANNNTYIHFHIIALNELNLKIMKKIYSLKSKINNNSEFIFYDGKKVEKDFELGIKDSKRGAIDYGRLIIPELLNDINKVISIDIGDILVEKDLNELYELNIEHYGYLGVIDAYPKCFLNSIFNHKENYVNGGVILLNVEKWKELNLYQYIVKMFKYVLTQTKFYDPYSDIMNDFLPWGSTGFMPLKYNHPDYININKTNQKEYKIWTKDCSYYRDKRDIVIEAENNVVIRNLNNFKVYEGKGTKKMKKEWNYYAKLTGFYDEICKKYIC